ncbi:MAG TPA: TrkA family potassium uptake protein [Actinomycetales bacterium]|nr:TrkA family potassium uptake protein [Actinomycetales bacterium]
MAEKFRSKRPDDEAGVLVIGLGRFGTAIASALEKLNTHVLGIEKDGAVVQHLSARLTHLVEADASVPEALEQAGAAEFDVAVVGVGTSIEASVLITANLVDLEVPQIWAKAISAEHARILERIGAHHVVLPEASAGERVAHLVNGRLLDYIEFEDGFTIVKMHAPTETHNKTLAESQIRQKYGVTIIGVKSLGKDFVYAVPETRISPNDILIASGRTSLLERFAARP